MGALPLSLLGKSISYLLAGQVLENRPCCFLFQGSWALLLLGTSERTNGSLVNLLLSFIGEETKAAGWGSDSLNGLKLYCKKPQCGGWAPSLLSPCFAFCLVVLMLGKGVRLMRGIAGSRQGRLAWSQLLGHAHTINTEFIHSR